MLNEEQLLETPILVEISDDPLTGLKRKTRMRGFYWIPDENCVKINTETYYFEVGEGNTYGPMVSSTRLRPYEVLLMASNASKVNGSGMVVPLEDQEEGLEYYGEYDFYVMVARSPAIVVELVETSIMMADTSGKFNT